MPLSVCVDRNSTRVGMPSRTTAFSTWAPSSSGIRMSTSATVGLKAPDLLDRRASVFRRPHQLEVGPALDRLHERAPEHGVVLGDQDSCSVRHARHLRDLHP